MNRYLFPAITFAALLPVPAAAQVEYQIALSGPQREQISLTIDTRNLKKNQLIPNPRFTANLVKANGTKVPQIYALPTLYGDKVYLWTKRHGLQAVSNVYASDINWAKRVEGGKADETPPKPTDLIAGGDPVAVVPPPPSAAMVVHCNTYANIAMNQARDARQRQCPVSDTRWTTDRTVHYRWCLAQSVPVSNRETEARAQILRNCAGKP